MNKEKIKLNKRTRRRAKIRVRIFGTKNCPRLSVFRSNRGMYLQLIDDQTGRTLISADSREIKSAAKKKIAANADKDRTKGVMIGYELGKLIAEKAKDKKIDNVVFDRGGYKYHGRVKAVADGAREGGLKF